MDTAKRATVYFDPDLHQALRLKSAVSSRSVSEIVNDAVRRSLAEDASDLAAFEERAKEPSLDFEAVVRSLRKRGKI
ncbi:MAG: CopG family transcriptional regulator [Burkholderiales bacterium]|nr:CopG family transcriptional regulator [Burkholderiales bacterium]